MVARLTFPNVDFVQGSGQKVRVALGEKFGVALEQVPDGAALSWATVADPVTDLREATDKASANVEATAVGKGEIQIQGSDREVVFYLEVEVYNAAEAVSATAREVSDEPRS